MPKESPLTEARVALGRKLFFDPILSGDNTVACASCHKPDLSGNEQIQPTPPALVGAAFLLKWQGRTAGDLFDKIRTTMPPANPAGLGEQTYLDLVAYLLQVNNVSAGPSALKMDVLRTMSLRGTGAN